MRPFRFTLVDVGNLVASGGASPRLVVDEARTSLGTKQFIPRPAQPLVHRPRLEARLAEDHRSPVTLVSAPPGAGKTTLVAAWSRTAVPGHVLWLTVDAEDNDQDRFAELVVAALAEGGALRLDRRPSADAGAASLTRALVDVVDTGRPWVLVIDDVHELTAPSALRTLDLLVGRAPACLHLVLCSRADPPLRTGRLRLDGRLGEIRNDALSFTWDEAAALFDAHGLTLGEREVDALLTTTEGWAAGLRLAAQALEGEEDPRPFVRNAAATEAAVAEYLFQEVLCRQSQPVQEFLLRTSIVDRVRADLAAALTGDEQAPARLAMLERKGLFLAELQDCSWYRFHPLFAAMLRARLRQRDPDTLIALHRRAAAWYLEHDMRAEAESHVRQGRDWPALGPLVVDRWLDLLAAGRDLPPAILTGVPAPAVASIPGLALVAAADACQRRDRGVAIAYRDLADEAGAGRLGTRTGAEPAPPVPRAAPAVLDAVFGYVFGSDDRARRAARLLRRGTAAWSLPADTFGVACLVDGMLQLDDGAITAARTTLGDLAETERDRWIGVCAVAFLAVVDASAGRLSDAARHAEMAIDDSALGARRAATEASRVAMALVRSQRGELLAARNALPASLVGPPLPRAVRNVERVVRAALVGDGTATVVVESTSALHPLGSRALISLGVLEVVDEGRRVAVGGDAERAVLLGRQLLATGLAGRVHEVVAPVLGGTPGWVHPRTKVEATVIAAIAAGVGGHTVAAVEQLDAALELAGESGITAPLLAHGLALRPVLERHLRDLSASRGIALDVLELLRPRAAPRPVESLTASEHMVLHYLPTLMSNAEIADRMHLSVNTVKTHLKAVYRKLGVGGRRDAVRRGRELELLERIRR